MNRSWFLVLALAGACGDDKTAPDAPLASDSTAIDARGPDAPAIDAPPGSVVGVLFLNEIIPSNQDACADELGDNDDFIELYNAGDTAIDLGGFTMTDDLTNPTKALLPAGLVVPAHGFLQIWCDEQPEQGPAHIAIKLSAGGEDAAIFAPDGSLVDSYTFPAVGGDQAFARFPDGTGAFALCGGATCGTANGASCTTPPPPDGGIPDAPVDAPTDAAIDVDPTVDAAPDAPPVTIYVNEVMPSNTASCPDGALVDTDWFELYNAGAAAVDLGGYSLTDSAATPTQFVLPAGTSIPAGGVLLFFADGSGSDARHPNFKLSKTAETVQLYAPGGTLLSELAWTATDMANDNVALARLPDGTGPVTRCATGTCGALNGATCTPAARTARP